MKADERQPCSLRKICLCQLRLRVGLWWRTDLQSPLESCRRRSKTTTTATALQHPGGTSACSDTAAEPGTRSTRGQAETQSVMAPEWFLTLVRHWTNRPRESALVYAMKSLTWIFILQTQTRRQTRLKLIHTLKVWTSLRSFILKPKIHFNSHKN